MSIQKLLDVHHTTHHPMHFLHSVWQCSPIWQMTRKGQSRVLHTPHTAHTSLHHLSSSLKEIVLATKRGVYECKYKYVRTPTVRTTYCTACTFLFFFFFLTDSRSSKSTQDCAWESGRLQHMIQWIPAKRGTWQRPRVHMRLTEGSLLR